MCLVLEIALKLLFLPQNHKNPSAAGGYSLSDTLELLSLFSTGPKLDNFCAKILLLVQTPSLLAKSWLRFRSHSLLQTDFSSDCIDWIRNETRKATGLIRLLFQT